MRGNYTLAGGNPKDGPGVEPFFIGSEPSVMVREGLCFVVVSGEFPKVAVDVVGVAALGFQLNGHVFDAGIHQVLSCSPFQ